MINYGPSLKQTSADANGSLYKPYNFQLQHTILSNLWIPGQLKPRPANDQVLIKGPSPSPKWHLAKLVKAPDQLPFKWAATDSFHMWSSDNWANKGEMSRWKTLYYPPLLLLQPLKLAVVRRHLLLTQTEASWSNIWRIKPVRCCRVAGGCLPRWTAAAVSLLIEEHHSGVGKHVYGVNMLSVLLKTSRYIEAPMGSGWCVMMVDVGMMWYKFWRTCDLVQCVVLHCGSLLCVCVGWGKQTAL